MKQAILSTLVFLLTAAVTVGCSNERFIGQEFLTDLDNLSAGESIVFTEDHWWVTDGPFYYRKTITRTPSLLKVSENKSTEIWKRWYRIKGESGKWMNYHLTLTDNDEFTEGDNLVYEKIKDDPSLQYLGVNGYKGNDILIKEYELTDSDKEYFTDIFKQIYKNESRRHLKDGESPLDNHSSWEMYDGIEYKSKSLHFSSPVDLNWFKISGK